MLSGKRDGEAAALAARLAAVAARDLPHDRQPQPAVERLEQLLALALRHARPGVADTKLVLPQRNSNGRQTVLARVLQQVADHPPQQARIAAHGDRLAVELDAFVARALLGGEREQV